MRTLLYTFLLTICCATSIAAQQPMNYRFDNFDARGGVQIETPQTSDALAKHKAANTAKPLMTKKRNVGKGRSGALIKPVLYAAMPTVSGAASLAGFTTGNAKVDSYIVDSGIRNGVDPVLLYAVMHQESSFKARAMSNKGAAGLMQLMPGTALRFGVRDRFDPRQSVEGGARYIRFLLNYFGGDVHLALAGYNAGEGAVLRYGRRVPPYRETQDYVRRISQRYELMRDPSARRAAPRATLAEVAAAEAKLLAATAPAALPPPSYERNVFAVRLPDGTLRLVSQ